MVPSSNRRLWITSMGSRTFLRCITGLEMIAICPKRRESAAEKHHSLLLAAMNTSTPAQGTACAACACTGCASNFNQIVFTATTQYTWNSKTRTVNRKVPTELEQSIFVNLFHDIMVRQFQHSIVCTKVSPEQRLEEQFRATSSSASRARPYEHNNPPQLISQVYWQTQDKTHQSAWSIARIFACQETTTRSHPQGSQGKRATPGQGATISLLRRARLSCLDRARGL